MSVTLNDLAAQQWSYLYNLIKAETASGKRLNNIAWACESTGHSGNVTAVDVRKSTSLWEGSTPAIGVKILKVSRAPYATTRHLMTVVFHLLIATQDTQATVVGNRETQPNMDDCLAKLQALVSDGNGNGLSAILEDPANKTLGGNANEVILGDISYADDDGQSQDADINAAAWFTFTTKKLVQLG